VAPIAVVGAPGQCKGPIGSRFIENVVEE